MGGTIAFMGPDLMTTSIHEDGRQQAGEPMSENRGAAVRYYSVQQNHDDEVLIAMKLNLDITRDEFLTMPGPYGPGGIA